MKAFSRTWVTLVLATLTNCHHLEATRQFRDVVTNFDVERLVRVDIRLDWSRQPSFFSTT